MRLLVTSWSGSGHLLPLLAAVNEMVERGHEVVLVTDSGIGGRAASLRCGVEVLPSLQDLLPDFDRSGFKQSQNARPVELRASASTDHFLHQAEALVPFVVDVVQRFGPDVIYRDYVFHAGWLAGLLTGIPVATFAFFPMSPSANALRHADRYLRAMDTVGAAGDLASLDQWLTVYGLPSSWFGSAALSDNSHLVQPVEAPGADDGTAQALLAGLADRPTVYATLGTEFNSTEMWDEVFEGVASFDVNVIATLGASADIESIAAPANVRIASFVPQQHLLPHCQAVIGHGGYGTLMGALRRGLPIVSIPAGAADNVPNAIRLEFLGAGRAVLSPHRDAAGIATALHDVLADPTIGAAAGSVAAEIAALPRAQHAATLIEQLGETRLPVLSG